VCKKYCDFLTHCSKVAYNLTFKLKERYGDQKCARVLDNGSENSKFVSKYALDKIRTYEMKVTEIMIDQRKTYLVGVSFHTTRMTKKKAKELLEEDAKKQYTLLWRYVVELRRVSTGNTFKINAERTSLTYEPRFRRFYFCFDGCKKAFIMM